MFRKIVTESTFSPALAASLGEYIKKVRKDTIKRQVGFVFVLLAIAIQCFATFLPPESANASNPEVFIDGGVQTVTEYLTFYDHNADGIQDFLNSLGVTRLDIEKAIPTQLLSAEDTSLWLLQNTRDEGNSLYHYSTSDGASKVAYFRPLSEDEMPLDAFVSSSPTLGWFAILQDNGNIVSRTPALAACSPWTPALGLAENPHCNSTLEPSVTMRTVSSRSSVTPELARPSDRIMYTLSLSNTGDTPAQALPTVDLSDILEYSQLIDRGGGFFDPDTKILSWPQADLAPQETLVRSFIVRLLPTIPAVAQGEFVSSSYDCAIGVTFGNTLSVPVECPLTKRIEKMSNTLPRLSATANLVFILTLILLSLYLLLRSKQMLTELYVIRHNHLGTP